MTNRTLPLLALAGLFLASPPLAGPITVGPTQVDNNYPKSIAFEARVSSSAGYITRAELHLALRGDSTTSIIVAPIAPAPSLTAHAVWETFLNGVPPGAAFTYQWFVRDDAGNTFTSPEQEGMVLDPRYPWKSVVDKRVGVWWY